MLPGQPVPGIGWPQHTGLPYWQQPWQQSNKALAPRPDHHHIGRGHAVGMSGNLLQCLFLTLLGQVVQHIRVWPDQRICKRADPGGQVNKRLRRTRKIPHNSLNLPAMAG